MSIGGKFNCEPTYAMMGSKLLKNEMPIYKVWELFKDKNMLNMFNDYDIIRDNSTIVLFRLNEFLLDIGNPSVESVSGYTMI